LLDVKAPIYFMTAVHTQITSCLFPNH